MANPSLQIGNSNWAIKEDNLLGYSTAGTRFVPQPITMTRASAGTRVNSSGLVETVELLGSEDVRDGNFLLTGTQAQNTTGTYWTTRTGWTISGGSANIDGSQSAESGLIQSSVFTSGKTYKLSFNITSNGAAIKFWVNGSQNIFSTSLVDGLIEYTFTASATGSAYFEATSTFIGSISNVSVKEYTANNLARVDYDGTASSLLVEPERTNLITYSSDFSQSVWIDSEATTTLNQTNSPDGNNNGAKLIESTSTSTHSIIIGSGTVSNTETLSVFAKKGDRNWIALQGGTSYGYFDLENGVLGGTSAASSKMVSYSNDWYKCSITFTRAANTNNFIYLAEGDFGASYTGNGTSFVYIWAASLELGSYPTSYIPTDGGTVTRVQDQYSKTGISNLINSEEGVLFVEMAALTDDETRYITLSDGVLNNNAIRIYYHAADVVFFQKYVGGTRTTNLSTSILTQTDFNKLAVRYNSTTVDVWANGVKILTNADTNAITLGTLNSLKLSQGNTSNPFFGKVKQLQIFKTALTDPELIALTT